MKLLETGEWLIKIEPAYLSKEERELTVQVSLLAMPERGGDDRDEEPHICKGQ